MAIHHKGISPTAPADFAHTRRIPWYACIWQPALVPLAPRSDDNAQAHSHRCRKSDRYISFLQHHINKHLQPFRFPILMEHRWFALRVAEKVVAE